MNTMVTIRTLVRDGLLAAGIPALAVSALAASPTSLTAGAATRPTTHSAQALPAALRPVFYQTLAKDAGAAYTINKDGCAVLTKQKLKACFDAHGAHFTGATPVSLHLVAYGRNEELSPVDAVRPAIHGNQVAYEHGNLSAWWRVLPMGFEQGFTIAKRPSGHGELTLALATSRQDAGAPSGKGTLAWGKLRYGKLVVTDANGKVVPATLTSDGGRVLIAVNDTHAAYPLTVDPLVWLEQQEVTANDGEGDDNFGLSVALDGKTALIGAHCSHWDPVLSHCGPGAAYVFTESNGTWTQTAKLSANDGVTNDHFGYSVALDGKTALIGALCSHWDPVSELCGPGAAYVFKEAVGIWTQKAELIANDGAVEDNFGLSVALDGGTALVGAPYATVNNNVEQGAAYVFTYNGVWTQTLPPLTASNGTANARFGISVALDGTTALVGAPRADVNGSPHGAAYVFTYSNSVWTQTLPPLTASNGTAGGSFGNSVALDGTTALVGAPGAEVNGSPNGAAYVFTYNGVWTQALPPLTANDGVALDEFGYAVALDGTTALVGAPWAEVNGTFDQGTAYLFTESGDTWTETAKLIASDGAVLDIFGYAVALDGTTALVGAPNHEVNGHGYQGVAYIYGEGNLGLNVSAPQMVVQGANYVSQAIVTNNDPVASPAVSATMAVPAAASFIFVTATQGSCAQASGVVTCDFGPIAGNGGTATANVTLKATGSPGTTINNTASVALATPPLTASALTVVTGSCPVHYTGYHATLRPGQIVALSPYQAPAGQENAILYAPAGFRFGVRVSTSDGQHQYVFPGTVVRHWGPAGTYKWGVKANTTGGTATLCINHP